MINLLNKWRRVLPWIMAVLLPMSVATAVSAGQTVDMEERVTDALVSAVAAGSPWPASQITVSDISVPNGFLWENGMSLAVELPRRDRLTGRLPFQVVVTRGSERERYWFSAHVDVMVDAVVVTRPVGRHQVLEPSFLNTMQMPMSRVPAGAVTDLSSLVGLQASRRISQGRPVTDQMVEFPPLIHRGDRVTLLARRPGMSVTAIGEARQDGPMGGTIQVINLKSRRTVQGRVIDAGTVEIEF
ncbi:MAG: flagellar basal body P-ring formation chaperone FlgA [Leptospirillia bacterium]